MSNPETIHGVVYYLIDNKEHFVEKLRPFTEQKSKLLNSEEHWLFSEEIKEQYDSLARSTIGDEITKKLGIPLEEVILILENVNLDEYLQK
jgi:uncharacterized FlgJ-related protein